MPITKYNVTMAPADDFVEHVKAGTKARNWFLTITNPESNELPRHASEKYAVWQLEKGESGTPQLHSTVVFPNAVHFGSMQKLYPRANISKVRKLPNAIKYCHKEESRVEGPWTRGDPPKGQGKRTDLEAANGCVVENLGKRKPFKQACREHAGTMARRYKGVVSVASQMDQCVPPEVTVYVGKYGAANIRAAREQLPEAWIWNPANGDCFDGYLGQKQAIFEEYRGQLEYATILSILDRHTHDHQVEGGGCRFDASRVAFTSPMHPREWYPRQCEKDDQLLRRITTVVVMEKGKPPVYEYPVSTFEDAPCPASCSIDGTGMRERGERGNQDQQ